MRETFEWQTEQEGESTPSTGSRPETAGRRRLLLLLIVGLAVGLAAFLLWRRAQQRVEDVTADMEEAVLSSHELALAAARDGDKELFASLLTTTNPQWAKAQETLLERDLLFGGAPRLLGWRPLGEEAKVVNVTLSPELEQAAVKSQRAYAVRTPEGFTETIVLTQTHHYRREGARWLLSPPGGEEGAGQRNFGHDYVTLDAPARDEALAGRLAADLDALFGEMCRAVVRCPDGFRAHIHLEGGPLSLVTLAQPETTLTAGRDLTLPAPSLVGRPTDEAGYHALFRGYARHVVAAVVAELVDYECCDHALFFRALLERQLAHLGLQSMPTPPVGYALIDEGASLDAVQEHWLVDRPDVPTPPVVHAFLDFLVGTWVDRSGDVPAEAALMRALNEPVNVNFWAWIANLPRAGGAVDDSVTEGWRRYVMGRLAEQAGREEEPPINFDLLAACGSGTVDIWRYEPDAGQWLPEGVPLAESGAAPLMHAHLIPLPDGDYVIRPFIPQDSFNTWLVRRGEAPISLGEAGNPLVEVIPFAHAPDGRLVAFLDNKAGDTGALQFALFDPQQCDGGCPLQRIPGLPVWSPDGSRAIALQQRPDADRLLLRDSAAGDDAGWELLGEAPMGHPFWLDETTVGYLRRQALYGYEEVVLQSLDAGGGRLLLSAADLQGELGPDYSVLELVWVARHPFADASFLLMVTSFGQHTAVLLTVERPADGSWMEGDPGIRILAEVGALPQSVSLTEPHVSPDGRWLSFILPWLERGRRATGDRFWVYDLWEEQTLLNVSAYVPQDRSFGGALGLYGWSPDGEWLARLIDGAVELFARASETRMLIPHDFERCTSVAWITAE